MRRPSAIRRAWAGGLVALGLAAAPAARAGETLVQVRHTMLQPSKVVISVNDTVVFHNLDEMPGGHTIVADDGSFQSPPLPKDGRFYQTFTKPGTYGVHVQQHPNVTGTVEVR